MGGSESSGDIRTIDINRTSLQYLHDVQHNLFGHVRVYQSTDNNKQPSTLYGKIIVMPTADMTSEVFQKLSLCCNTQLYDDFLKISAVKLLKSSDSTCSIDREEIAVFFEGNLNTLDREIARKIETNDTFTESQIWDIALSLVSAAKRFHSYKIFCSHLTPRNILINSKRQYLINNPILSSLLFNKTLETSAQVKEPRPPSLMRCMRSGSIQISEYNPFAADIYLIGLVLYELITLQSPLEYYDFKENMVDLWEINNNLKNKTGVLYSSRLIKFVKRMLETYDKDRPSAQELWSFIVKHETLEVIKQQPIEQTYVTQNTRNSEPV